MPAEKQEEVIEASLSVIDHLSIHPDSAIHPFSFELMKSDVLDSIGEIRLRQSDLTEDEAKKSL
jgi:hypothetical protein